MTEKRNTQKIIHAVAECEDCDFVDGYFLTAQKSGRNHAIKTGHTVCIETGYAITYNKKLRDN